MLDLETIGTVPGSVVTQVSCVPFHLNGKTLEVPTRLFNERIHIGESLALGFEFDPQTLEWWRTQDPKVMHHVFTGELRPADFCIHFKDYIKYVIDEFKDYRIWSTSAKVDFGCLALLFSKMHREHAIYYRNERCARTFVEMAKTLIPDMKLPKSTVTHDAIEDCEKQIKDIQCAYAALRSMTDKVKLENVQ